MVEKYEEIFSGFKKYIKDNSEYDTRVVKYNTHSSPTFPIITCVLSNNMDTNYCTIDKIENYESYYFTIDIYTKDITSGANVKTASQVISEELCKLTMQYFGEKLNMKKTLNRPTPNLDNGILRRTIKYQCLIGSARGNIIRR